MALKTPKSPAELPAEGVRVNFRDGPHLLRPLHAGDEEALKAFFRSHTRETVYYRYGYAVREMTDERARNLVRVDQSRDPALGLFGCGPGAGVLHAVGRYYGDAAGLVGEVAFVTRESKRGQGMATCLLERLVRLARHRGLVRLEAQVLSDNTAMLRVFEKQDFKRVRQESGTWIVELVLRDANHPGAPARLAEEG
jgi:RimJ/RimL family protein N-acetyltransferase